MGTLREASDRLVIGFEKRAAMDFMRAGADDDRLLAEEDAYLLWRSERDAEITTEQHEQWLDELYHRLRWERDGNTES
ncbi:MAG TPA: hypothetical protein VK481_00410 [Gemmatimonadaceae bacterium]|nr:hypothetical protein [Gemmatimonadaceae bacterium]